MKFKSDFFLYSSHLRWMDQKVNEIINSIIKNELKLEEKDSLSKILNIFNKIKSKIFESADTISVSIMSFPSKLEKIREFQFRYVKKVKDFSQVSQDLAASAEELDAILSQFSENMSDTNSAIKNISESSQTITDNLQKIDKEIFSISGKSEAIRELQKMTSEELSDFSKVVAEMKSNISLIKEISDQVSFLALNASIEAARAGEEGKGFSVVADGVSQLAERSKHAVRVISESIQKINDKFGNWKDTSEKSITNVKEIMGGVDIVKNLSISSELLSKETSSEVKNLSSRFSQFTSSLIEIEKTSKYVSDSSVNIATVVNEIEEGSTIISKNFSEINQDIESCVKAITNQNPIWLLQFINSRRLDHINWVISVDKAIENNNSELLPQLDHTKCKMGLWYYLSVVQDSEQNKIHQKIEEPHRLLHNSAIKIKEAINRKDIDSVNRFRKELQSHYERIAVSFDEYVRYLENKCLNYL